MFRGSQLVDGKWQSAIILCFEFILFIRAVYNDVYHATRFFLSKRVLWQNSELLHYCWRDLRINDLCSKNVLQ